MYLCLVPRVLFKATLSHCSSMFSSSAYATCKGNFYTCPSGRCIHQSWVCDGDDDCEDNADEAGCGKGECNIALVVPCKKMFSLNLLTDAHRRSVAQSLAFLLKYAIVFLKKTSVIWGFFCIHFGI